MKPTHVVFCQIEDGAPTPFFVTSLDAAHETVRLMTDCGFDAWIETYDPNLNYK